MWGDAAGKFVRGGVGARGGDFIVLLQRRNVVSHGPDRGARLWSVIHCAASLCPELILQLISRVHTTLQRTQCAGWRHSYPPSQVTATSAIAR